MKTIRIIETMLLAIIISFGMTACSSSDDNDNTCTTCNGTGSCTHCHATGVCPSCNGQGILSYGGYDSETGVVYANDLCSDCWGEGYCFYCKGSKACYACNGTGKAGNYNNNGGSNNNDDYDDDDDSGSGGGGNSGKTCRFCLGTGRCREIGTYVKACEGDGECRYCLGSGWLGNVGCTYCAKPGGTYTAGNGRCYWCGGSGKCSHCGGSGHR